MVDGETVYNIMAGSLWLGALSSDSWGLGGTATGHPCPAPVLAVNAVGLSVFAESLDSF